MSWGLADGLIEEVERERLAAGGGVDGSPMTIVDPMVGSGTVLGAARARGHRAIGFDIDPLAVLITEVAHCAKFDARIALDAASSVLGGAKGMTARAGSASLFDDETQAFIKYWFDDMPATQLEALASRIAAVEDVGVQNVLWCAMSRLVIAKQAGASRAADLAHSRPHRVHKANQQMPFDGFVRAVQTVLKAASTTDGTRPVRASVAVGDARRLAVADGAADLVITSPPYINAIDYMRCSKFSLVWMGHEIAKLRGTRSTLIGTEVGLYGALAGSDIDAMLSEAVDRQEWGSLGDRRMAILARYAQDMLFAMGEIGRILKGGGMAALVVSENSMRGVTVQAPCLVRAAAEMVGLKARQVRYREIPASGRYLPPPSRAAGGGTAPAPLEARMRREALVVATKT